MQGNELAARYRAVRDRTVHLCAPLTAEDQVVQTMPDASPTKWHLAHTTWFFEAFVLGGKAFDASFEFLFNSYYDAVGARVPREHRGMLTRPPLDRIHAYRREIDRCIGNALAEGRLDADALGRLELGLHHEEQHQELILTDAKHVLGTQPHKPPYRTDLARPALTAAEPVRWRSFGGGVVQIGAGVQGFAFDNERPRHDVIVAPFELSTRPVTSGEVLAFIEDGGYREPRLWLSDGWHAAQAGGWQAPLYWNGDGNLYDLAGVRTIDPSETACHLSYYEADAIARWLGCRLPTEYEWEHAASRSSPDRGHFADADRLHPDRASAQDDALGQIFGDVWEWTASSYSPYPGFRPLAGVLGEYNGKFMSGQQVLRGGSCFTPRGHVRSTYRNFFQPAARWQMTGLRIAKDS